MNREWTYRDLETLRMEYPVKTAKEIAEKLGRGERAVYIMAYRLGLKKDHYGTVWTQHMLTMIRALFPITFNNSLARCIGVSKRTLIRKARELGLEKEPGFKEKRKNDISAMASDGLKRSSKTGVRFQKGFHYNTECEFKKGHVESPETKAKRAAAIKENWRRRKQQAKFRKDYNINNI